MSAPKKPKSNQLSPSDRRQRLIGFVGVVVALTTIVLLIGVVLLRFYSPRYKYRHQPISETQPASSNEARPNSWPIYQNHTYGFQFRYRPDLTIEERPNGLLLANKGVLESYDKQFYATISILDNQDRNTPRQYASTLCRQVLNSPKPKEARDRCRQLANDNLQSYQSNQVTGIKTKYNLFENPSEAIIFPHNNYLVLISATGETGSFPSQLASQTIDHMLSSFAPFGSSISPFSIEKSPNIGLNAGREDVIFTITNTTDQTQDLSLSLDSYPAWWTNQQSDRQLSLNGGQQATIPVTVFLSHDDPDCGETYSVAATISTKDGQHQQTEQIDIITIACN